MKRMYLIPVRNLCNSNCTFCYMQDKKIDLSKPQFIDVSKLEKVMNDLEGTFNEVEMTGGGEPSLHPEIDKIVSLFQKNKIYTKMYTNGFFLPEIKRIDEINISRVHWDSELNGKFYNSKFQNDIGEVLEYYRPITKKIRMQTILLKGAIDSKEKILDFVSRYENLVDVFMFRTLFEKCEREKDKFVPYPEMNHPKVVFDETLDNYKRDLYFVNTDCEVKKEFDYE